MKTDIGTIADDSIGLISRVESSSDCSLKSSNKTLEDVDINPSSPLNDFYTTEGPNSISSIFDEFKTHVNSILGSYLLKKNRLNKID